MTVIAYVALLPLLGLIAIFYMFPIVHNIYLSMTNYSSLNLVDYVFIGGYNYKEIFIEGLQGFASMFIWTICFAVGVQVITFIFGAFLGTVLDKRKIVVAKIYKLIFILPWVVPSVITLLTWKGILATDNGALNALLFMDGRWKRTVAGRRVAGKTFNAVCSQLDGHTVLHGARFGIFKIHSARLL